MFNMAMSGQRDENPYVNHQQVQQDVEALYRAGQGKVGTVRTQPWRHDPSRHHMLTRVRRTRSGFAVSCCPDPMPIYRLSHRRSLNVTRRAFPRCMSVPLLILE